MNIDIERLLVESSKETFLPESMDGFMRRMLKPMPFIDDIIVPRSEQPAIRTIGALSSKDEKVDRLRHEVQMRGRYTQTCRRSITADGVVTFNTKTEPIGVIKHCKCTYYYPGKKKGTTVEMPGWSHKIEVIVGLFEH
jgi:hypothetical protein